MWEEIGIDGWWVAGALECGESVEKKGLDWEMILCKIMLCFYDRYQL